jgi:DNA mismatch repair protein MutS2
MDELPVPDLLSRAAAIRVDASELRQTLIFAFATGGTVDAFDRALERAALPRSTWDRTFFARDVFLDALLTRALALRIGGREFSPCAPYLARALAEPPADPREAELRRGVLGELVQKKPLRTAFERVYQDLVRLRALFCVARDAAPRVRRLEILRSIRGLVDALADGFEGAESALDRLGAFGAAVRASAAYKHLDALLDHEEHMATLDLRVRVGADGELSAFQVVAVRENDVNPFYVSAFGRWMVRLTMFFRGIRATGGVVIESLFEDVFAALEPALVRMFQLVGDQEFYLASLGLRDRAVAAGLPVCFAEMRPATTADADVTRLWNPLLLDGKTKPVPCDLTTAGGRSVTLITGPNSGGKTRLLQAIAIAQTLAQAGAFVPAARAVLPTAEGLFVSLLEEARADQPEGQLGMELLRIRRLFEELQGGCLVLLDELCSGTNPSEGEEIAELVLSLLPEVRARAYVTTHLLSFAQRLASERPFEGLDFVQVALDDKERPTFGFVPGVAKTSLARHTAARLGVTRDELCELIARKKRAATAAAATSVPGSTDGAEDDAPESAAARATSREARASRRAPA